ncbi:MAG TPA: redoxin domain-containing protein [Terriglobales bacterium]
MRILAGLLIPCWTVCLFALQASDQAFEQELEAGKQAVARQEYVVAIEHFTRANGLRQGKCSECYVWLARIDLAGGKIPDALEHAEKAAMTAANGAERARAQLYRGVIFGRQSDLVQAEAAFKSAVAADPACLECKFNLGFVLLNESKDTEGVEVLKDVAPAFAGTPRGHEIERFIDNPGLVRKDLAPQFSARASDGQEINLDTFKGKVVLVDFWGTWCAPCRASLPLLKDLASKIDPAKVAIVSIDEGDSKEKWQSFIRDNGMNWTQVYDGDLALHHAFRVDGYPRYYLLSKDGMILAEFKGWNQDGEATISKAINQALGH